MPLLLIALGAVLAVAGAAFIFWPAALLLAGVFLIVAGVDLAGDR